MGVLATKHRPTSFEEVIGQKLAVKVLKSISKNPQKSPKSLILAGEWGTGKTTCARIVGKALACEKFANTGKVCGRCIGCESFKTVSNRYYEYDSSMVGNVQQVKELRHVFDIVTDHYRAIVIDEAHLISRQAQSSLLKVIEDGNDSTFFIFCTTEYDKLLKTIQSRSLHIEFFKVSSEVIITHLRGIAEKENFQVDEHILNMIAFKADGHVRDALMLLNGYMASGDESILNVPINDLFNFFNFLGKGQIEFASNKIKDIMTYPIAQIQRSLNYVITKLIETHVMNLDNQYKDIVKGYGSGIFKLFKFISESWVQGVFVDKYLTYSFFLTLTKMYSR